MPMNSIRTENRPAVRAADDRTMMRVPRLFATWRLGVGLFCLIVLALPLTTGCGSSGPTLYHVTGVVTYQDKPLPLGTIMFVPTGAPPSQPTQIGPDGRYELDAVAGTHAVMVVAVPPVQGQPDPDEEGGINYSGVEPVESLIPEKYNRYETSGVSVVVESKSLNEINIALD